MNSLPTLLGRVRSLMDEGLTKDQALRGAHREIAESPETMAEWWDALGIAALERLVAPHVQDRRERRIHRATLPAKRPSWRAEITPGEGLDLELPVGGTRKRVRDFTPRDIDSVVATYRGMASAVTARAEKWSRLKRTMNSDDTIGSALEAGRLRLAMVEFIGAPPVALLESGAA